MSFGSDQNWMMGGRGERVLTAFTQSFRLGAARPNTVAPSQN